MKFKLLSIIFMLVFMFSSTCFATDTPNILLNGIPYTPNHPVVLKDGTLFMTIEDFSLMSFSSLTTNNDTYHLKAYNKELILKPNARTYTIQGKTKIFGHGPFIQNGLLYIPVDVLEPLGYNFTYDKTSATLSVNMDVPFSQNIDLPSNHITSPSEKNLKELPPHIISFESSEFFKNQLDLTVKNDAYIAYVDNTHFQAVSSYFAPKFKQSPYNNMNVTFRLLDTRVYPNKLVEAVTYPVKVDIKSDAFDIQIGNQKLVYPSLWSTYYPTHSLTSVDINKTFDMTLMRAFYEYYRNLCDLRDDKYFSSFEILTNDRTNVFSHKAYSVSLEGKETHYTIKIYRVHPTGSMHYLVDIALDYPPETSSSSIPIK